MDGVIEKPKRSPNQEAVAHRSLPTFSTAAPESAQILVTAMDLGERMGHAEALAEDLRAAVVCPLRGHRLLPQDRARLLRGSGLPGAA